MTTKKYKAVNIKWETDGHDVDLPSEIELPSYIIEEDYEVAEYLSKTKGWLVNSFSITNK